MLRDLDKRQAPELGGIQSNQQESLIEAHTFPYSKIAIIALLVLILSLLIYFLFAKKEIVIAVQPEIVSHSETEKIVANTSNETILRTEIKSEQLNSQLEKNDTHAKLSDKQSPSMFNHDVEAKKTEIPKIIKQDEVKKKEEPKIALAKVHEAIEIKSETTSNMPTLKVKSSVENTVIAQSMHNNESIAPKSMGVKLSPIALDQQMAERALSLISQQKETEAYRELYAFIGEHEEDLESRTVLATYLLNENRMAEVGDVLLNAPLSKSPKLRQLKARWFVQQGEHNLALYTLNSDLPDVSKHTDYYVLLAAYYQRYGTAKAAKETYSTLVNYDETVADWWAGLGLATDRNNEKEKAIYAYQQALDLKGLSSELLSFVKPRLNQLLAANTNQ